MPRVPVPIYRKISRQRSNGLPFGRDVLGALAI
jgi:hypothetical protein